MTTIPHTLELTELKTAQLKSHPLNPRTFLGDLSELAASITRGGIQSPLIVTKDEDSKAATPRYLVIAGHRRLAAANLAGRKTVPCLIRDDLDTEQAQLEAMLVENVQRIDLTPIEEGDAYQQLMEFPGYTMKRITEQTGRGQSTVRDRIKMAKLPKGARDKIHDGQISLTDAHVFVQADGHDDLIKQLEDAAGTTQWSFAVQRVKERIAGRKEYAAALRKLTAAGVPTVESNQAAAEVLGLANQWEVRTVRCGYGTNMPEAEDHQDCPGRLVVLDPDRGILYELCSQAELHQPPPPPAPDDSASGSPAAADAPLAGQVTVEEAIQETEEQAERRRIRDDLATAAAVREQCLGKAIAEGDEAVATLALRALAREEVLWEGAGLVDSAPLARIMGITDDDWGPTLRRTIDMATLNQLAIMFHVGYFADLDRELRADWPSTWANPETPDQTYDGLAWRWRNALTDVYGYEWSRIELDMLAKHNPDTAADQPGAGE